ncbi:MULTISPECIES: PAS domain S-box protein [unclassified Methanoculleus]|uniref:PAS domain S-box protein n=1 Tax=unclassified Methanoculleus TaxID=2619537 RepID=UPI0025CF4154|nr:MULTISPECIES: PAS domain S-box protein [unclassified Methanoculleus]MCK9317309.1 PAS domain S-box protein [Methanoculleus sp.]MDD2253011.1 PAS domain S-box protein [Methanoculleus sp.]MDD2787298.1 PAS domain S-box protein [Methanoculleus sp.]MDD3216258.1 PAS domain S-box protein [Methanoculleus sp.]MDD4313857.1 PAS domain S-box protein [Methanoculleus sp.]
MTLTTYSGGRTTTLPALAQGDGILIVDADQKIVQANAPLQALLSAAREELIGADALDTIRGRLSPLLAEGESGERVVALLRDGPYPPPITIGILVPGSGIRRVSITSSVIEGAKPVLRLLVFHDTGKGGAEPVPGPYRDLPPVFFGQDRDLRYTGVFIPGDAGPLSTLTPGTTDADLFCPEETARLTRLKRRVLEAGEAVREEIPLTINKTTYTIDLILVSLSDSEGEVTGLMGAMLDVTGQRRPSEALLTSERQLATLMSNLRGMAYRCRADRKWAMEFVSEGAKRITGYAPDDLVGNRRVAYADLIHPDDRERVREEVTAGLAEGKGFQMTYRLITASGQERWVWEQGRGVPDSQGGAGVIEGYITDITDRVRAEAALAESEERFRTIFEEAGIGIILTDTQGRVVKVNPALQQILGYSADEFQEMTVAGLTHPDDVEESSRCLAELVTGERDLYRLQKRYVTRSGGVVWARATVTALRDADGTVRYTLGMVEDITARKQAEEDLAESEERFRSIFTTSHAVMLIIDPETGAIVDANPAASAYYGYPREVFTTMRISDINTLSYEEILQEIQKAEPDGERHFSFRHRLADGRVRDVNVFSGRVVVHGRVLLHSIVHDITEQRRAEEQFRALLDAIPDAALLIDRSGTVLALNEVMAARLEKSVAELLRTNIYDLFPPELAPVRREAVERAVRTGSPLRHVDERSGMVLEGILFPIPGSSEEAERVAIISRDITRQQELERARKEAFSQIEQNIEQFAVLADHIRQPLQVILGMACLGEDERVTGTIRDEVERINGYIRQLDRGWIESRKIREFLRRYELV